MEAEQRGRPSKARRPLIALEFEEVIDMAESIPNKETAPLVIMLCNNQIQYDCANGKKAVTWRHPDLKPLCDNPKNYGVIMKLSWSKNIRQSRDTPNQILFGAMDCW